jgi:hypothetical protein
MDMVNSKAVSQTFFLKDIVENRSSKKSHGSWFARDLLGIDSLLARSLMDRAINEPVR